MKYKYFHIKYSFYCLVPGHKCIVQKEQGNSGACFDGNDTKLTSPFFSTTISQYHATVLKMLEDKTAHLIKSGQITQLYKKITLLRVMFTKQRKI